MADEDQTDDMNFNVDEVEKFMSDYLDQTFSGEQYNEQKVPQWINQICDYTLKKLLDQQKPYKYMINTTIMQKNGAGLQVASSCFWDAVIDNSAIITWPKEKGSKQEQVTIYATSLNPNH